ncbi:endogenous retrovirus group K member 8 Gag polyprotein-like isoform 1-T5 [Cyanocitta cristata]
MKPWRAVTNCLKQYQVEKQVAAVATAHLEGKDPPPGIMALRSDYVPTPPIGCPVMVKPPTDLTPCTVSTAPPVRKQDELPDSDKKELQQEAARCRHEPAGTEIRKACNTLKLQCSRVDWRNIIKTALENKDYELPKAIGDPVAFPEIYQAVGDKIVGEYSPVNWKLLTQLRGTVNESGLHSEPAKQMLNYIWGCGILCPEDIKTIVRMIMTPSQVMLWQAHWQRLCEASANTPRDPQDPLHGVTVEQLMGVGQFARVEIQVQVGPEKLLEAMRLARQAMSYVKTTSPQPSYLSIKQGRDESFSSFVDRVTNAIHNSDVQDFMKGPLLRQCVMENCNPFTRSIIVTLPADAPVELMLDRMS